MIPGLCERGDMQPCQAEALSWHPSLCCDIDLVPGLPQYVPISCDEVAVIFYGSCCLHVDSNDC